MDLLSLLCLFGTIAPLFIAFLYVSWRQIRESLSRPEFPNREEDPLSPEAILWLKKEEEKAKEARICWSPKQTVGLNGTTPEDILRFLSTWKGSPQNVRVNYCTILDAASNNYHRLSSNGVMTKGQFYELTSGAITNFQRCRLDISWKEETK